MIITRFREEFPCQFSLMVLDHMVANLIDCGPYGVIIRIEIKPVEGIVCRIESVTEFVCRIGEVSPECCIGVFDPERCIEV